MGFEAYRQRDFKTACSWFGRSADDDRLCSAFLARCVGLIEQPPDPNWDGVWEWKEK